MNFRKISLVLLILTLSVSCAYAKKAPKFQQAHPLTPDQEALVAKAIAQEKLIIRSIRERSPLVETYIQQTRPDEKLLEVPVSDQYMLSRVDFGKAFFDKEYTPREEDKNGFFKGSLSAIRSLTKLLGLDKKYTYNPTGFMDMMFLDPTGFDQQRYVFSYVRKEFLGSVRTWVFDVHPKVMQRGLFYGRIWIEDQGGNVVRFNGTYTGGRSEYDSNRFFHFDSWRMNVQPGLWLPVEIYVEESNIGTDRKPMGLKAQTRFWGYSLRLPTRESENVNITVDNAVDKSSDSQDVSPLQAEQKWVQQAQDNVLDRLEEAGLLAPMTPDGYEQKVLDQIVINLAVPNNLAFETPVHCRVLLTDTIEATTVGNTILISKGLLDTLPNEESIASVVALELAHVALGHHIDTKYAFNDRLLFPDEATFQRIDMAHTQIDDQSAVKEAMKYLETSMYKDKLATAGLYWEQLADRGQELKALNTPLLGDSMLRPDGTPWMLALAHDAPKINWDDLSQIPAFPLGSWLKVDAWSDHVHMLDAKRYAPMNARDKMPLEVTPIYFRLERYEDANAKPATPNAEPAAPNAAPATQPNAAPPTTNGAPAGPVGAPATNTGPAPTASQ
ncbi:MAG TPA: hypothetical protein VND90_05035 [Terracidiphilus sp.]|nr:hypothetical protein [Terracidiphilus sp.]